jgi:hypothetical protein
MSYISLAGDFSDSEIFLNYLSKIYIFFGWVQKTKLSFRLKIAHSSSKNNGARSRIFIFRTIYKRERFKEKPLRKRKLFIKENLEVFNICLPSPKKFLKLTSREKNTELVEYISCQTVTNLWYFLSVFDRPSMYGVKSLEFELFYTIHKGFTLPHLVGLIRKCLCVPQH